MTLTGTTTSHLSDSGNNDNDRVLHTLRISKNWSFTIKCSLGSYPGELVFRGSCPSAGVSKMKSRRESIIKKLLDWLVGLFFGIVNPF